MSKRFLLFLYLIFCLRYCVEAQENYTFQPFTNIGALSNINATKLLIDHTGFLWIGSDHGLFRFDGANVLSFTHNKADTASISGNEINDICEDNQYQVWVATNNGVCVLWNGGNNIRHIACPNNQSPVKKLEIFKGRIIAITNNSILNAKINSRLFTKLMEIEQPFQILKTTTKLFVNNDKGLYESKDGVHFSAVSLPDKLLKEGINAACFFEDSSIFFVTKKRDSIYCFKSRNNNLKSFGFDTKNHGTILSLLLMNHSLLIEKEDGHELLDLENGLYPKRELVLETGVIINDVAVDYRGTIFLATNKGLLAANKLHQQFHTYEIRGSDQQINGCCYDHNSNYWLIASNGISSFNPYLKYLKKFSIAADKIQPIINEHEAVLVQNKTGLSWFNISTRQSSKLNIPSANGHIVCESCIKDENNQLWLWLHGKGLYKCTTSKKDCNAISSTAVDEKINAQKILAATTGSQVFFVTDGKPEIIQVNTQTNESKVIDISSFKDWKEQQIMSIACNKENELWLGTSKNGIVKVDLQNQLLKKYYTEQQNGFTSSFSLLFDDFNQLWASTNTGLKKIAAQTGKVISFTTSDGLPESNLEHFILSKSHGDSICLLSSSKLIVFHPLSISLSQFTPKVIFQMFNNSGVETPIIEGEGQTVTANYNDKSLSFTFTAINFIDPEKTRFAYTLENYECGWNYTDVNPIATYGNLPEGDYVLKVKASNRAGFWEVPATSIALHINGPFWYKWWFYGLCVVALLTVSYIVYYLRLQQLIRIVSIRDKISKDLHDDIGSALSSINIYGATAKKLSESAAPEISNLLDNLQQTAVTTMENMSDIVWAINPEHDSFEDIINRLEVFSRQMLQAKGIAFDFEVDSHARSNKLSMLQRRNFYFIAKEAVNNAAKYSEATHCSIKVAIENKSIVIIIADNGKGFKPDIQNDFGGNGITSMNKRAEEMKGRLKIETGTNGTRITLKFLIHL